MSEYGIIFQVIGGLLALFFIYLTYMNTKTWRWVHVTFTFLVFAASVTFTLYAAMTLKTRATWVKKHDDLEKQVTTTEEQIEKVSRGDPKDVEGKDPSVLSVREELSRLVLDRGRVWRGAMPNINRQTGVITVLTSPPADPNNPAAGPPKKHNIQPKTIVHVFREAPQGADGPMLPAAYIGEFRATPVNDQSVTLEPTAQLLPEQIAAGQAPGTWALYETMPADGHEWFAGEKDEERLASLNAAAQLERVPQPLFQQMVAPYLRDGTEATDTDPPENVWYEVKFEKEYEVTVDAPVINTIDAEPFNTEGQSVLQRLRRGNTPEEPGTVKFGPGPDQINTAVLDQQTAQSLIEQGIATLQKKIYRRKLTDYERKLHSVNERLGEISGRLRQLDIDNKAMLATTAQAGEQQKLVEELKGKINDDLAKVRHEVAGLDQYLAALRGRLTTVQTELSQLYLSNKAVGRELARLTADLTDQIDLRSREATASAR